MSPSLTSITLVALVHLGVPVNVLTLTGLALAFGMLVDNAVELMDHPRAGDLVLESAPDAWFAYPYWLDDARAPDFARTVDIHRKPGYDPMELLVDPEIGQPKLHIARRLLQKWLGFRYYMDVIGTDAKYVKGRHGRLPEPDHTMTRKYLADFIALSRWFCE